MCDTIKNVGNFNVYEDEGNMYNDNEVPDIIIHKWMRTLLNLSTNEAYIFSYIFSQTFDAIHVCYTSMAKMERIFGLTRQAINRNMNKLVDKNLLIRESYITEEDSVKYFKHNKYKANIKEIIKRCEDSGDDNFLKEFLKTYTNLFRDRFPDAIKDDIEDQLFSLSNYISNKDSRIVMTQEQYYKIVDVEFASIAESNDPMRIMINTALRCQRDKAIAEIEEAYKQDDSLLDDTDIPSKEEQIEAIKEQYKLKLDSKKPITMNDVDNAFSKKKVTTPAQNKLLSKPKRKSKKTRQQEWYQAKLLTNETRILFTFEDCAERQELLELLDKYLQTEVGMSFTPSQWDEQIDYLIKHGRTLKRMVEGVRTSYMRNYRQLYFPDKSEVDMDEKFDMIDKYVYEQADNNAELNNLLRAYVTEVTRGKSCTANQFKLALENLSNLCDTTDSKIASVKVSYANSYSALAYPRNNFTNNGNNSSSNSGDSCVDEDKKLEAIDKFIEDEYYQNMPELKDALIQYATQTNVGKNMSVSEFISNLNSLLLYCLDDNKKVSKVMTAIKNNYRQLAMEDYAESKILESGAYSRKFIADTSKRERANLVRNII